MKALLLLGLVVCACSQAEPSTNNPAPADGLSVEEESARFAARERFGARPEEPSSSEPIKPELLLPMRGGKSEVHFIGQSAARGPDVAAEHEPKVATDADDEEEEDREAVLERAKNHVGELKAYNRKIPENSPKARLAAGDIEFKADTDPTPDPLFAFSLPKTMSLGGYAADAQLAASATHVCVTARAGFICYTKGGLEVPVEGSNRVSANDFFAFALSGSGDAVFDLRAMYDHFRDRFWIVGLTSVSKRVVVGVSQSGNPRKGWYKYWLSATDSRAPNDRPTEGVDYPQIGIDGKAFYVMNTVASSSTSYFMINVADAVGMANGSGSASGWVFWDLVTPDGNGDLNMTVHETSTSRGYMLANFGSSKISVFAFNNPLTASQSLSRVDVSVIGFDPPIDGPQKPNTTAPTQPPPKIQYTNIGNDPIQAVYRSNQLTFTANDSDRTESGARIVHLDVTSYASGTIAVKKDRFFKNSGFHYGWAAAGINASGNIAVASIRTASSIFPEIRASAWFANEADIRPSALVLAGGSALFAASGAPVVPIDIAGTSLDPFDDDGIYFAEEYPSSAGFFNHRIRVFKMFGSLQPDIATDSLSASATSITHGNSVTVTFTPVNQGDTAMPASKAQWYLSTNNLISTSDSALGSTVSVGALAVATVGSPLSKSVVIPAATTPGSYFLGVCLDSANVSSEFSEANNCNDGRATSLSIAPIPITVK